MKKSFSALSALALALTSAVALPSAANAQRAGVDPEAAEFCKSDRNEIAELPLGTCVSNRNAADESYPARVCTLLDRLGAVDIFDPLISNVGDCVTYVNR